MFKLVILCVFEPLAKMPERISELSDEFNSIDQAALRAYRWMMYRPNDIIMIVPEGDLR